MRMESWNGPCRGWMAMAVAAAMTVGTVARAEAPAGRKPLEGPAATQPSERAGKPGFAERRPGERIKEIMDKLMEGVNPSDEQKTKIHAIMEESRTKMEAWRKQHETEMTDLRAQMQAAHEAKDREKAMAVGQKMKALWETAPAKPKDIADQVRAVLTDDQRKTFDANREKVKEMIENQRQRRGADGMDGKHPQRNPNNRAGDKPAGDKNKLDI